MNEDEFAVQCRQSIVDDNVDPLAVLPDVKMKDSGIVLDEQIVLWYDVVEQVGVSCGAQRRRRRQKPTVTYRSTAQGELVTWWDDNDTEFRHDGWIN